MDNRIYEKSSSTENLWILIVGLMFGLGIVWIAGV